MSKKPVRVAVTGAAGQIGYALLFRIAAGDNLEQAAAFAVRVGAYAATGAGAQNSYPTAEQLATWTP